MANVQKFFGSFPELRVGQTRLFPRGETDGVAMREVPIGNTELVPCPGDVQLVRTFARARQFTTLDDTSVRWGNAFMWHVMPAKFLLKSCDPSLPNERLIDAGRQIVMPGGDVSVRALVPASWTDEPDVEPEGDWIFELGWNVCPPKCCYPPLPQLTAWSIMNIGGAEGVERTWKVPPGAKRLFVTWNNFTPSIVGGSILSWWMDAAGGILLSETNLNTSQFTAIDIVGGASEISIVSGTTTTARIHLRWEIEG